MIEYVDSLKDIVDQDFKGFFEGWPNPPTVQKHIKILENSNHLWLALLNDRLDM